MGAGPLVPLEFSRISPKRLQALAVCIDRTSGSPCPTNVIRSVRSDISEAVADLAARERAAVDLIGWTDTMSGTLRARDQHVGEAVTNWCRDTGWKGAVWTDLDTNFGEIEGGAFSVARAIAYLRTLSGPSRDEAVTYITRAPESTCTSLRQALEAETWWLAERARLGL